MKTALTQALAILAAATVLGAAANTWGPRRLPWRGDWDRYIETEARRSGLAVAETAIVRDLLKAGTHVTFDARRRKEFAAGHLPGAVSLPWMEADRELPNVEILIADPAQPILVYCRDRDCEEGLLLAGHLRKRGHRDITLYAGGFGAWRKSGAEVEK